MSEHLQEFCDSRDVRMRVDRVAGVIRGVKILGLNSRNGRQYLPEALSRAAALYEGAKVNVNHPKGAPSAPRDYQDRIGVIRGVEARTGEGLFGDLYFNPKHILAEQLIWDAEHAPENVGFSHNVQARTARRDDIVVVEEITRVQSVDLVADPATTRGLYEATQQPPGADSFFKDLTLEQLEAHRPDLVHNILERRGDDLATADELARLQAELGRLTSAQAAALLEQEITRELAQSGLPQLLITELFREQLRAAPGDAARRQLVLERLQLARAVHSLKPLSKDQHQADGDVGGLRPPIDAQGFASQITA